VGWGLGGDPTVGGSAAGAPPWLWVGCGRWPERRSHHGVHDRTAEEHVAAHVAHDPSRLTAVHWESLLW
jgi:hypothetical protein